MKQINLKNFTLKQVNLSDKNHLEIIESFNNDDLVKKYIFPHKSSFYELVWEYVDTPDIFNTFYLIYHLEKPIGYVEVESSKNVYLNYALLNSERNKGYASLFLKELSDFLIDYKNVISVEALVKKDNIASIKVLKNAGLIKTGEDNNFIMYKKTK